MVRICAFPNCGNKMKSWKRLSFHRLPFRNPHTLSLWLAVLNLNVQTPLHELRERDYRVCSEHFNDSDFHEISQKSGPLKRRHLKKNAIPRAERPTADTESASTDLTESESTAILQSTLKKTSHKHKSSRQTDPPSTLTLTVSNPEQPRLPSTYGTWPLKWKLIEDTDSMMSEMCIIEGCDGTEELLSFPTDPSTLQQWMLCLKGRLKHPVNSSSKVCSAHFTSDSLEYWQQKQSGVAGNLILKTGALPSHLKDACSKQVDPSSQERTSVGGQCDLQQTLMTEDTGVSIGTPSHTQRKETSRNSFIVQERNALMSDIVVKLACLLQLFQRCLKCCSDACSISTRHKGPILHVVQQCWSCGNIRDWTNQPPPDLLLPYPIISLEAKEEPAVTSEDMEDGITIKIEEEEEAEEVEIEEESEKVEEEQDVTEEKEEEEENQKPKKRKRMDSDGEWASNDEAAMETSDEEFEGSDEEEENEEETPHQWTWCCDCGVKASTDCFRQNHLQVYCCVQCGYRDGYQEPKNIELQETPKISLETPCAGHQEGTCDVSQAAESSCSPEDDWNNKSTAYSDCPKDPNRITSQGVISDASHTANSGTEEPVNICVDALSCSNNGSTHNHEYGVCTRRKWGSRINPKGSIGQRSPQNESPEDTNSSNDGRSHLGSNNNHEQEATDKQNIPIYAVYFKDPYSLQRHMRCSHGGKRELCPDCGKFMYRYDGKSVHVCGHKIKPFSCLTCGRRFTSEARLQLHIQFHNEDYTTKCQYCYKTFKQKEDKQRHEETHNGENLKFRCPECPKRFANVNTRKCHLSTAHFKGGRFVCKVCDKGFHFEFKLKRHEVVHTGVKPYSCELCNRSFNQPGHLRSHMRVHTGERPFMCHECGLCFNHNVSLKNHIQRKHRSASDGDDGYREEVWDDLITGTQSDG